MSLGIPIDGLDSGQYKLVLEVTDLDNSKTVTRQATFHIIKDTSNRRVVI